MHETITSEKTPKAVGPYSPAVKAGDFIWLSGQLPLNAEGNLVSDDIEEQTRQCLENMKALLEKAEINLSYVLKTTVYLTDMNDFAKMNAVYAEYFSEPYPARSAVEVTKLAKGARVEMDAFAIDTRAIEILCACDHEEENEEEHEECDGKCCCL